MTQRRGFRYRTALVTLHALRYTRLYVIQNKPAHKCIEAALRTVSVTALTAWHCPLVQSNIQFRWEQAAIALAIQLPRIRDVQV